MRRIFIKLAWIAMIGVGLAGCDKCGHRIQFHAPSLPHAACGDNAGPER